VPEISVSLQFRASRLIQMLCLITAILVLLNTIIGVARYYFDVESVLGFSGRKLILDQEANIPTWFQSVLMLSCALLLAATSQAVRKMKGRYSAYWAALSVVFLLMSLDEVAVIHELTGLKLGRYLGVGRLFYHTWIIPALAFLFVLSVVYFKFILSLPRKIAFIFVLAGCIFVGGSVGMEMIGGVFYASRDLQFTFGNFVMTTIEETMETSGLIVFIYGILQYLTMLQATGTRPDQVSPSPPS
jgi:hypothetical protein